jgi:hypothetical protein
MKTIKCNVEDGLRRFRRWMKMVACMLEKFDEDGVMYNVEEG